MKKFKYPLKVFPRDKDLQKTFPPVFSFHDEDLWEATFFGHTLKKYGHRAKLKFEDLVKHIALPQRRAIKWDGDVDDRKWEKACQKCFAPVVYKENRRLGEKVQYITMMVWDIDSGKTTYDDVLKFLQDQDMQFIMHTSYSHTPEKHKFRVIQPLHKAIPVAYFPAYEEYATKLFVSVFDDFPDHQAMGNKANTYNCAYLTPHYRGDWSEGTQGSKFLGDSFFDEVQKRFEVMQRKKSFDFLGDQFKSTSSRTRHPCHTNFRKDIVARLNTCETTRESFATSIGARKRGSYWEKWLCPLCGKKDATSFHAEHGRAFCNHKNKCGGSWLLPELASLKGWDG
jgi:hypothetical protein